MSYFTQQTQVVKLDDENTVTVKRISYGERQTCIDKATVLRGDMDPVVNVGTMKAALLHAAIVAWAGPGFEDRPVTPANIDALPVEIGDRIAEAADALQAGLSDDEKKA